MGELRWVFGVVLLLGGVAYAETLGFETLIEAGQGLMLRASALGIPFELVYFSALAIALRGHPERPRGWYWRSFEHHHLLSPRARLFVLPWFYLGALAFLGIGVGIASVLLAFVVVARDKL